MELIEGPQIESILATRTPGEVAASVLKLAQKGEWRSANFDEGANSLVFKNEEGGDVLVTGSELFIALSSWRAIATEPKDEFKNQVRLSPSDGDQTFAVDSGLLERMTRTALDGMQMRRWNSYAEIQTGGSVYQSYRDMLPADRIGLTLEEAAGYSDGSPPQVKASETDGNLHLDSGKAGQVVIPGAFAAEALACTLPVFADENSVSLKWGTESLNVGRAVYDEMVRVSRGFWERVAAKSKIRSGV